MDSGARPAAGGGREDCWSDGATEALVEAWGDRYLQLSRGNLRQKDWKEVAESVNDRQEAVRKPLKTDVQCKNRIDTLKKKYKLEKSKPGVSHWPFFSRLDLLIGPGSASPAVPAVKKPPPLLKPHPYHRPSPPNPNPNRIPSLTFTVKNRNPNPSGRIYSGGSSESSGGESDDDDDEEEEEEEEEEEDVEVEVEREVDRRERNGGFGLMGGGKRQWEGLGALSSGNGAYGELARAIVKFAEIYERVESSKQQQMMELERQRMEFAKDLEFQRMQMFMETQLELEKIKRPKYASGSGKRS